MVHEMGDRDQETPQGNIETKTHGSHSRGPDRLSQGLAGIWWMLKTCGHSRGIRPMVPNPPGACWVLVPLWEAH